MSDEIKKEIKVALYLRVSTDEQVKEGHYGLDIQEEKGRSFCESQEGYVLKEVYRDEGVSGALPIQKRPALTQLFEDAKERKFNVVIVYKTDRLARDLRILLNTLEELTSIGVDFRSVTEPFDTTTVYGKSMLQTMGMFAELEKGLIRERTCNGRETAAREGKYVYGLPPFGFRKDKKTEGLEPISTEIRMVKQLFKWLVDDKLSLREIQRRVNNNSKLPAPKYRIYKKKHTLNYWHKRTINRILTNEIYTGFSYARKYKRTKVKINGEEREKRILRPKEEWISLTTKQTITPELFREAQRQLSRNREFARRNQKRDYLFSKIIYCGVCGFKMFGGFSPPRKKEYSGTKYYHGVYRKSDEPGTTKRCERCKQYAETRLEPIWDSLKEILRQPKIVFSLSEGYTTKQTDKVEVNNQLKQVGQELDTIENKRKRLTEVYLEDHDLTSDEYGRRKKELDIEEGNLKNESIKLNQFLLSKKEKQERGKSMKKLYNTIKGQLDTYTYDEKVRIVRLFVHKISLLAEENIADVVYQFPNEYLIPVFNSNIDSLKDNHIDGNPAKNSIISRDNNLKNSFSKNTLDLLENGSIEGYSAGNNVILQDNHPRRISGVP